MAKPSTQHKLDRVRPPRVQITYDVETGGAIEIKELPFVVGVLGDFTGQPEQPLPKLKERRFVEVTPDNFDSVLESMKPHLSFAVENKLSEDSNAGQIRVDLKFKSLEDFERKAQMLDYVDHRAIFEGMKKALGRSDRIELRGFGVFTVKPRKTGVGRNPRTGAEVSISPGSAVRFKPGKELHLIG